MDEPTGKVTPKKFIDEFDAILDEMENPSLTDEEYHALVKKLQAMNEKRKDIQK